ncbi:hypothetical protein N7470_009588 [Penicillium chermesinum]|nr:hypothetical protein N7470_009588 [Penicillium chermesinum]
MKFEVTSVRAAALVALIASVEAAHHGHQHVHRHAPVNATLQKRGGQCEFPSDAGLVAVTPGEKNAGWAMSPDQACMPGHYCPYACPSGQVSMQWDPKATSYSYPMSMNGGLYCDENGEIQKPFPNKDYCEDGTGALRAQNKAGKPVSFCQTVLPGNEAMLIPTLVEELTTLAVPGTSYWCETAAQYYINAPGVSVEEGCVWGSSSNPVGNWSPYTAGANTDADGNTFAKIGWNPIYLEPATPFRNTKPEFGIEIVCEGGGCNGLPCKIDPSAHGVNEMSAADVFTGAGGATGCVVTVPSGSKANVVVFAVDGSSSGDDSDDDTSSTSSSSSTSSASRTSSTSTSTSSASSTSSTQSTTSTSTTSISTSSTSSATGTATVTATSTSKYTKSIPTTSMSYTYRPHVFQPTANAEIEPTGTDSGSGSGTQATAAAATTTDKSGATSALVSMMSLVFGAAAALALRL